MSNFVIGTAGHVDHGKTTLIKALTGIDPDRLPQEKSRGMTLDLGFAHITLPSGRICGIVDVPGHEKYLKNMLAGVGGIDFAILVVDCNEGVKAQTREHMEILHVIGLQGGLVCLTKADKADEELMAVRTEEVRGLTSGTFLENSPVIPVSTLTGAGLDRLKEAIDQGISLLKGRSEDAPFRMPIDRVFNLPGIGAVATGTVYQGKIHLENDVRVMPVGKNGKVRRIQVHGSDREEVSAGQRAAINLSRIDWEHLSRGQQVVAMREFNATKGMDVLLHVLPSAPHPVRNKTEIRLYLATHEVFGRLILLDSDVLEPGGRGYARLETAEPVVALAGDPFVIRNPSSIFTWGGGKVLDPQPSFHRRFDQNALELLRLKESDSPMAVLEMVMDKEPYSAYNQETLAGAAAVSIQKAARVLGEMEYRGLLHTSSPGRFTLKRVIDKLSLKIMETMSALLSKKPEDPALRPEEIRMNLPKMEDRLFREIIGRLKEEGRICEKSGLLFPADYRPVFPEEKTRCFQWVAEVFARPGFSPPSRGELLSGGDFPRKTMEEVLGYMAFRDDIVAIDDSIYMTGQQIGQARKILGGHILKNGPLTPSQAAKLLGTTRKYAIPLLEYLDKTYFTRRIKEGRVLFRDNIMAES